MRRGATALALWVVLGLGAAGCYGVELCGAESCDGRDDDCDGTVDEGFVDAEGRYSSAAHCGGCGLRCDEVFPSADRTECVLQGAEPTCRIAACPQGQRDAGDGACVPEVPVLCLPCESDGECALRDANALCLRDLDGGRCGAPCAGAEDCPGGFRCQRRPGLPRPQCVPVTGTCACTPEVLGAEFACVFYSRDGDACAGLRLCSPSGLGICMPALDEACNGEDDDCDGVSDEGFVDARGRYLSAEHCGQCGAPCSEPGPNMQARCVPEGEGARCESACIEGFVDVDGVAASGCECQLMDDVGAVIGGDSDCDGAPDETPDYIFVAQTGDDQNDGEQVDRPVRSLQRGIERGAETGRAVLVARGIYSGGVQLIGGARVLGGYSPDFRVRDSELHPVVIEQPDGPAGEPVLRCHDIRTATRLEGVTVVASEAETAGAGSTAIYLDGCGPEVELSDITVIAARGAPGLSGRDSSANLDRFGLSSLGQLSGVAGGAGAGGSSEGGPCAGAPAGEGGDKICPRGEVSGGEGGASICTDLSTLCVNGSGMPCGNAGCTDFTVGGVCDVEAAKAAAVANPPAEPGQGAAPGAPGAPTYASPTNRMVCHFCDDNPSLSRNGGNGLDGAPGVHGAGGEGCDGAELLDAAQGLVMAGDGEDGEDGADGSGGGGGTAGAGFSVAGNTQGVCGDISGGSGGGGGSGGCGAPSASAGGGGGASVGVLMRLPADATAGPRLRDVRVVTASGGDGGAGGIGAAGGPGGAGGLGGPSQFWCARDGGRGGDGGSGGAAGGAGGGCGGGSYGIYLVGDAAQSYRDQLAEDNVIERAGVAGRGGQAGFSPGNSGTAGRDGRTADIALGP